MPHTKGEERNLNALFEALVNEFVRTEAQYGHVVLNPVLHELWWPDVWIATMQDPEWRDIDAETRQAIADCRPLDRENLNPMSDELRRLARQLNLPLYEGLAKAEASKKTFGRCAQCGDKVLPVEVIAQQDNRAALGIPKPLPELLSGMLQCKGCGHESLV